MKHKKFKLCLLYLSIFSFYHLPNKAFAEDSVDLNLKGQVGNKQNNVQNMTVNSDGSIVLKANKNSKPEQKNDKSEQAIELSGSSGNVKNSQPNNKYSEVEKKLKDDTSEKSELNSNFSGGIGKAFYSETGVLVFNGSNYKKADNSNKNETKNNSESVPLPPTPQNIALEKAPADVRDSPIPKSLPPLPSDNGNVMLPISLPTSKAVSLPPLPASFIPNLGVSLGTTDQAGINNQGVPVDPDGKPINYNGMNSIFQGEKNTALSDDFIQYMRNAANKFLDIGIPMRIEIVDTENFELRRFIATNILRSTSNNFESIDTGLTAILSLNTRMNNNNIIPVCYVVLKNDQQKQLMDKYIYPLSKFTDQQTIAAYLVAHEVSDCMDNLERYKTLPKESTWFPETAKEVGLSSDAVRRLYPYGMTYNQYSRTVMHLYDDLAQRQYQQRIGDIFGLYLTLFSGYDQKITNGIIKLRSGLEPSSAYNTYDAIKDININYKNANKEDVKSLWYSARDLQIEKSVDNSLKFGAPDYIYKASLNNKSENSESSITEEFKPSDHKDDNKDKDSKKKPIKFDSVPSFGGNKFGGNY